MDKEKIEKEKVEFLIENKDLLICNFASINYMLFNILMSNEKLEKIEEYKQMLEVLNNKSIHEVKYIEATEIIYYLSSILNKLCMSNKQKCSYRAKLYSYLNYFNEEKLNDKMFVKRKISA